MEINDTKEKKDTKVKIFVAYHKEAQLIKNEVFEPIHVGRKLHSSKWLEENMIGDDTGNNISEKNDRFCELTAQYFVWKNIDCFKAAEYIGFCHYRRFFNFNKNVEYEENNHIQVEYPFIDEGVYDLFGLNSENVQNVLKDYDITTIKQTDLKRIKFKNIYQQYKTSPEHNIRDYDLALEVLLEKYPEYKDAVNEYNKSKYGYFTNCYVMKREMFMHYSEWLFSILFEIVDKIPEYKEIYRNRVIGFIAERLLGIYITHAKNNSCRVQELQQVFVKSTENKNYIPIAFACNNNYVLPLCCAINSILKNAAPNDYFYFYILNSKKHLNFINKRLIVRMINSNCSIKFVSVDDVKFSHLPQTKVCSHISKETYYRYLLPSLFNYLNKILYLDCDITVQHSLAELYDTNIENSYFAGVEDILCNESTSRLNIQKYCNAGVLLFNLKLMRQDNIQEKLFKYTEANKEKIVWQDQDVLNVVLQDKIKYIDKKWNAQVGEYEHCYTSGYNELGVKACILHHIGCSKPWSPQSKSPFKNVFKYYLDSLPLLFRLIKYNTPLCVFFVILSYMYIKRKRKLIITYDKRTKQLILFNKYKYKIK